MLRQKRELHRVESGASSDWDRIAPEERSKLQRIAARTCGILTVGNTVTLASNALVFDGLYDVARGEKLSGLLKITTGRLGDLADGALSHWTETKSKLGAALDATSDWAQLAVSLPVLAYSNILRWELATAMALPKVGNAIGSVAAKIRHRELNATSDGKQSTGLIWGGVGAFLLEATVGKHVPEIGRQTLEGLGYVGTVGGTAWSIPAMVEYTQVGLGSKIQSN